MKLAGLVGLAALAGCTPPYRTGEVAPWIEDTSSFQPGTPKPAPAAGGPYAAAAARILATARADRGAYQKLAHLTDRIGNRVSGSPALDRAIAWAAQAMKDD